MTIPTEFTTAGIEQASTHESPSYSEFHTSGEPYRSLIDHNPWLRVPDANQPLEWGAGRYYDTTIARLHTDWADVDLPVPTKSQTQLQEDFLRWGYCIIEDGVSSDQCKVLGDRVAAQAEAERKLGIAHVGPAQQHVWSLVNKGEVFVECMQHNASAVQSGPLLEYLLDGWVGAGWQHLSFIANISFPDCHPQGMHQDQSLIAPYVTDVPVLVNTIYILQDVDHHNGGTLIIPGSHKSKRTDGKQFGVLPRPINLEAPAGAIVLTDGRLLHGGAVNRSDKLRYILTNSVVRPWIRQQECFHLTIRPDVLSAATDKFLLRCGFQATASRSMVEGYGYAGSGKEGDPNGALVHARSAMDSGEYRWVGELEPDQLSDLDPSEFTLGAIQSQFETRRGERIAKILKHIDTPRQHSVGD